MTEGHPGVHIALNTNARVWSLWRMKRHRDGGPISPRCVPMTRGCVCAPVRTSPTSMTQASVWLFACIQRESRCRHTLLVLIWWQQQCPRPWWQPQRYPSHTCVHLSKHHCIPHTSVRACLLSLSAPFVAGLGGRDLDAWPVAALTGERRENTHARTV